MFPDGVLLVKFFFQFPGNQCESVIWHRKIPDGIEGVHRLGCEKQAQARERQATAGKVPDKTYVGAATARCGVIRSFRNPQGHGVKVVHEPTEGAHHVHLCYDSNADGPALTRSDKNEIKLKLAEIFGDLSRHSCSEKL